MRCLHVFLAAFFFASAGWTQEIALPPVVAPLPMAQSTPATAPGASPPAPGGSASVPYGIPPEEWAGLSISLGSASEEVARIYGHVFGYFWRGTIYPSPPVTNETVYEVYRFKANSNEFELRISYYSDNTESRLHPTARVQTITMLADRPIVARLGLRIMPGAGNFCRRGCGIRRLIPGRSLLLTQDGDRSFTAETIQVFMNDTAGETIPNAMKDLDSVATAFVLCPYDYTRLPLTRGVKGGWTLSLQSH